MEAFVRRANIDLVQICTESLLPGVPINIKGPINHLYTS